MRARADAASLALDLGRLALNRKAENMVLLDVRGLCGFTDFMLIISGRSSRQVQALAEHVRGEAKKLSLLPLGLEGLNQGRWVVLDYGDVVVHIFLEEVRAYYDLEGIWSEAPLFEWGEKDPEPRL